MSLVDRFNTAIQLWIDLTGTDPNARSLTLKGWALNSINEEIKESMGLDESLVTTFFLLSAFSDEYFAQRVFTAEALNTDPQGVMAYMTKMAEFKALIQAPDIKIVGDNFQLAMRKALLHYGVEIEKVDNAVENLHELAFLRRDALRSMKNLRVDQFLKGERNTVMVPGYNPNLFQYWNVNSLIEHACSMPDGVALSLVRDPDELHSYFCFTIRNGGNLYTMSDVTDYKHPLQRQMSRRPDREYGKRASKNWFPYDLLNIAYNEDGDPYHDLYRESKESGLVPHQPKFHRYRDIKDFEIGPLVWTLMMFDMIRDRYWKEELPQLPMSYTGEMVRLEDQTKVLAAASNANLPITGYEPISLQPLTLDDVRTGMLDEAALGKPYGSIGERFGSNQWMEDRYGNKVTDEALNLLDNGSNKKLFLTNREINPRDGFSGEHASKAVAVSSEIKALSPDDYKSMTFFARDGQKFYPMESLDATTFGTRERLDADRKFIARHNYVKLLQREADREFEARRKEIEAWFKERVEANRDHLMTYAVEDSYTEERDDQGFGGRDRVKYRRGITHDLKTMDAYDLQAMSATIDGRDIGYDAWSCAITGGKASWRTYIIPRNAQDIMQIVGAQSLDELPDVIRHWRKDEPYTGNSILDRIDPMEWAIHNPWRRMGFVVGIQLSKRGRNRIQKDAGFKPIKKQEEGAD